MSMGKVWLFFFCAVLVATVVSSKQDPGIDSGRHEVQELPRKLSNHSVDTPAYRVTPKQAALNGPSNRRKFNGKWTSLKDNKRYSKTSRRMELNFNSLPHERSTLFSKKVMKPIAEEVFQFALLHKIPQQATNSNFFKGMATDTVNVDFYTKFKLQDTVYLKHVADRSKDLIPYFTKRNQIEFADFCEGRANRYETDLKKILQHYGLSGTESVIVGPAVQQYINYIDKVIQTNPEDLALVLLACAKLWPWMADNYYDQIDPQNTFKEWFDENRSTMIQQPGTAEMIPKPGTTELFVNKHFQQKDPKERRLIVCTGMILDVNLFLEAGKQKQLVPEEFCQFF